MHAWHRMGSSKRLWISPFPSIPSNSKITLGPDNTLILCRCIAENLKQKSETILVSKITFQFYSETQERGSWGGPQIQTNGGCISLVFV